MTASIILGAVNIPGLSSRHLQHLFHFSPPCPICSPSPCVVSWENFSDVSVAENKQKKPTFSPPFYFDISAVR